MEAYIEIWEKGTALRNERPNLTKVNDGLKYYHLYLKDGDGIHTKQDFWDLIMEAMRDMEHNKHRAEQNSFPNWQELRDY